MPLTHDQEQEVIRLTQDIIRQPGFSGEEEPTAKIIAAKMEQLGYDEVRIDELGSVIGVINGAKPGPTLAFDGHIDVVPIREPDKWEHEPHGAEITGDILWGRGTSDMKGPDAAMVCAAAYADRSEICGKIVISCSVAEEICIGPAIGKVLKEYPSDAVLITEPTNMKLGINEKGRAGFEVFTKGKVAHSSRPELGDNAIHRMVDVINRIQGIQRRSDRDMGNEVIELVDILSSPYPGAGSVPEGCRTFWECRMLPGETEEGFMDRIRGSLHGLDTEKIKVKYAEFDVTCYTGAKIDKIDFLAGWKIADDHPFKKAMEQAMLDSGVPLEYYAVPYGSNGLTSGAVMNIPTLVFGPGDIDLAHKPNEFIRIPDLLKSVEVYKRIIELNGR